MSSIGHSRPTDRADRFGVTSRSNSVTSTHGVAPVIFATDFHSVTSEAIRVAACFCKMLNAPLHCLHVLPRSLEGVPQTLLVPRIMSEALRHIYTEKVGVMGACVCAITYGSEISRAVIDYANEQGAQMIVLGVLKASSATRQARDHIAIRIINDAPCPVLTMAYALDDSRSSASRI